MRRLNLQSPLLLPLLCAIAALVPLLDLDGGHIVSQGGFPGWPAEFDGLRELPLDGAERAFNAGFPGKVSRFTDGRRDYVLRWVKTPTRRLHMSADCFRGLGYTVSPRPAMLDDEGRHWSCFSAVRNNVRLTVRERISASPGEEWTDVSSWFWSAMMRKTSGPWFAVTVSERDST